MSGTVNWQLAPMTETDIDAVQDIERQSFKQPWRPAAVAAELTAANAINLLAGLRRPGGGALTAGYVLSRCVIDELHLLRIAVAPRWRGRGAGASLLRRCIETAVHKGARVVYLEVRPSNRPALTLYRKHGFEPIAERPNYYSDSGENALILMKRLKEAA